MLAPQPARRRRINDAGRKKSAVRIKFCVCRAAGTASPARCRSRFAAASLRAPAAGVGSRGRTGSGGRSWGRARPRATPFRCAMAYGVGCPGTARAGVQADSDTRLPGSAGGARAGVRTWRRGRKDRCGTAERWLAYQEAGALFGVSVEAIRRHAARHGWRRRRRQRQRGGPPGRALPGGGGTSVSRWPWRRRRRRRRRRCRRC